MKRTLSLMITGILCLSMFSVFASQSETAGVYADPDAHATMTVEVITLSCTARQARAGDLIELFGFVRLQPNDVMPNNMAVRIRTSPQMPRNWRTVFTVYTNNGAFYAEQVVQRGSWGNYLFRAEVIDPSNYQTVTSPELSITYGDKYVPASNSDTKDLLTTDDEYKIGWATNLVGNILVKKPPFTSTNTWLYFSYGTSDDRLHTITLIGGFDVRMKPTDTGPSGGARLLFDGMEIWIGFASPFRYTQRLSSPRPAIPAIYSDRSAGVICYQGFDSVARSHYVEITDLTGTNKIVMKGTRMGTPFWIAKKFDDMLWMLRRSSYLEFWGAFVSFESMDMTLTTPQYPNGLHFTGIMAVDREWHTRAFGLPNSAFTQGQSYTAFYASKPDEFWLSVWKGYDPAKNDIEFSREGMLYLNSEDTTYRFDSFTITDDGQLLPKKYYLKGTSSDGKVTVNLTCEVDAHMFTTTSGTPPDECFTRPVGKWHGTVVTPARTITVSEAYGIGEEYRLVTTEHARGGRVLYHLLTEKGLWRARRDLNPRRAD